MAPIFRADQVGSLLRPGSLLELRNKHNITASVESFLPKQLLIFKAKKYDSVTRNAQVEQATKDAVAAVVQRQIASSICPITTGELERSIFYGGFFETLSGFTTLPALPIPSAFRTAFPSVARLEAAGVATRPGVVATGKLTWTKPAYGDSWALLKSILVRDGKEADLAKCKITVPSPTYQHMQLRPGGAYTAESGYASDEEYFADLAAAYRAELKYLYDAGCRNVQVDDPNMTFFVMDPFLEGCRVDGVDPDILLEQYVRVHNACIAGLPEDMHIGIHLCRGNMWSGVVEGGIGAGSYELIAQRMFQGLNYESFYLEYDDERSGDFEPLRFLPRDKYVILGLVSTKRVELERMEDLMRRVGEAAEIIAKAQGRTVPKVMEDCVAVSPQCGFASQSQGGGKGMTEDRQWEKLELVRDLARRLWKDTE